MTHAYDRTRPTTPADKLEYAIHLAKSGRKPEARDVLRRLVALQPVNQAAWLWLAALATGRTEAKAALAQARQINPAHPSLTRAEQWLSRRFSTQPVTAPKQLIVSPPAEEKTPSAFPKRVISPRLPPSIRPSAGSGLLGILAAQAGRLNKFGLGMLVAAMLVGVIVLLVGVGLQLNVVAKTEPEASAPPSDLERLEAYAPLLEAAQANQNWSQVITILEPLHQAEPEAEPIARQLSYAYLRKGITLRRKGFIEEALPFFEKAMVISPNRPQVQHEYQLASNYLRGTEYYQAGQWPAAIAALEAVWEIDRAYINLKDLLFSAYYNHGLALHAAEEFSGAKTAFERAITLRPDLPDSRLQLARAEFALAPDTPPSIPLKSPKAKDQLIVVGVAEQRMHVYAEHEQVFDFVVSTGEPGRDTAIGEFEILNKIDMAYASTWNLDMPYWMGIYWSGPLQNGIHSLPIVKHTGYKLWDGYLGQRVSYGCVILSDEDAATLYDWVEIGAKVKIVPSLADWSPGE
jgi:tetratricopeptide (TPR) repeat protein